MGPAAKIEDVWHQIFIHDSFFSFCCLGRARTASASRPACRRQQKTLFFATFARPKSLQKVDDKSNIKGCKYKTRVGMAGTLWP